MLTSYKPLRISRLCRSCWFGDVHCNGRHVLFKQPSEYPALLSKMELLGISQRAQCTPDKFQKLPSIRQSLPSKKYCLERFLVQSISQAGGSNSHKACTEILLLDSQKHVFLDREEVFLLKVECGPILLYASKGGGREVCSLNFARTAVALS